MLEPNRYRVRINGCPDWVGYGSCTLGISVGQPYHEGDKFAATVEWAARYFDHIRVDVSDTLQRHRLIGEGAAPVEAARASSRAGDRWIAEAMPVLAVAAAPIRSCVGITGCGMLNSLRCMGRITGSRKPMRCSAQRLPAISMILLPGSPGEAYCLPMKR